jgi:hypothetical protein
MGSMSPGLAGGNWAVTPLLKERKMLKFPPYGPGDRGFVGWPTA